MADSAIARKNMVESQLRTCDITEPRLLDAISDIPREAFLPISLRPVAYSDVDHRLVERDNHGQPRYMIKPVIFAKMLKLAEIAESDVVLDVGCATGYSAAVLSRLASSVVAIESDEDMARQTEAELAELKIDNVAVLNAPLAEGYANEGPYDAIILEGAVSAVPEALLMQLKDGGRLVAVETRKNFGIGVVHTRQGESFPRREVFDAMIHTLPGFAVPEEFML